jgi:peptide/nickel transport system substrate-binding protein
VGIEDTTTALAALRTGKIDLVIDQNGPTLQQVQSVAKTNPEIQVGWWSVNGYSVIFRCDTEPFTDINVRKALQLAINCPLIAQTHYSGAVDGTPAGLMHPAFKGWCTPYNEWPEELQEEYSYNPDKSKELLAAAGYPDGFSTNIIAASAWDLDLLQIIQSQFKDIGVDMEIQVYDVPVFSSLVETGQHDQMVYDKHTGMCASPLTNMKFRTQGYSRNPSFNNDPNYDAMFNRLSTASSIDEAKELVKEMDMYALQQHWAVNLFPWLNALMWQPWVKGYSAETTGSCETTYIARIWIDKE